MVVEMKTGFSNAMEELSKIQYGDQSLQEQLPDNRKYCNTEIDGVKQVVHDLKVSIVVIVSVVPIENAETCLLRCFLNKIVDKRAFHNMMLLFNRISIQFKNYDSKLESILLLSRKF